MRVFFDFAAGEAKISTRNGNGVIEYPENDMFHRVKYEGDIKSGGPWYGKYFLPSKTKAAFGTDQSLNQSLNPSICPSIHPTARSSACHPAKL